jgi:uncharacterized membrane protein YgaE (UPF0421/DUF939 family)
MDTTKLYAILIEIGLLCVLGILYYFFQKRRILKHAKNELLYAFEDFLYDLNVFLEENKTDQSYQQIQKFIEDTEVFVSQQKTEKLCQYLKENDFNAPNEQLAQTWNSIKEIIVFE